MADRKINSSDTPGARHSSISLSDEDDTAPGTNNIPNQTEAPESSAGTGHTTSQKTNVLKGYHSVDLSSIPMNNTDSSIKIVKDQLRLLGCTIKGKSVSADEMTTKIARGRSSNSDGAKVNKGGIKDDFRGVSGLPPFDKVTRILNKGRICRSYKIAPDCPTRRLSEVITFSPVVSLDQPPLSQSAGASPRKRSSFLNNNFRECPADKGETCVLVHHNISTESMENICRICHESPSSEKLIQPCLCKGSMGKVHRSCLERWLGESGKNLCEICGQEYNTMRVPKFTGIRSFFEWLRHPMAATDTRNFFFDLACFFILTPLAGLSAWLCILGAQTTTFDDHQKTHRHRNSTFRGSSRDITNSTWTSVGLLSLTGTLVTAYYIWIFIAVRYHLQIWRDWQTRNYIVTIQPLPNGDFSRPPTRASPEPSADIPNDDSDSDDEFRNVRPREPRRYPFANGRHPVLALRNAELNNNNNNNNAGSPGSNNNGPPRIRGSGCDMLDERAVMHQVLVESLLQQNMINLSPSDVALYLQFLRHRPDLDENSAEDMLISLATMRSMECEKSDVHQVDSSNVNSCDSSSSPTCSGSVAIAGHSRCPQCIAFAASQQLKAQAGAAMNTDCANANVDSQANKLDDERKDSSSVKIPEESPVETEVADNNDTLNMSPEVNDVEITLYNETSESQSHPNRSHNV